MTENKQKIQLSALNPFVSTNLVENVEKEISGRDFICWGNDNNYPKYLFSLYSDCATLQSIINGTGDFISGDDVICNVPKFSKQINKKGDTILDLINRIAIDYLIFGGFAIQIIKDYNNNINELYWVDFSKLRSDKKNEVFFYSEDWSKSSGRVKTIKYPKFSPNDKNATSIFYYKGNKTRSVYPTPIYNASIIACELEKKINNFHLNEINNNFLSSKIINFNSGIPDDYLKEEIEKNINEKFSGAENAGRILISFNDSKENMTTVQNLGTDNFADRYNALSKRVREQIFIAFRAIPAIFGLMTETTGFNEQEFFESYKLYNRTMVQPIQKNIINAFNKIFGAENTITIKPFSVEKVENVIN
jgi:hypothetical protein